MTEIPPNAPAVHPNRQPDHPNDPADQPCVWALVLHWRGIEQTRKCLTSLKTVVYPDFHILIVDNGSVEEDGLRLEQEFPDINLLRLNHNHGFAGGCNQGIKLCLDKGARLIWLLNNDTRVDPDTLSKLVDEARRNPSSGALGARMVECIQAAPQTEGNGRGIIDFFRAKTYLLKDLSGETVDCHWLSGSNLLLRREALDQCGLFDETYFLYFEDTELCHRLRLKGWSCLFVPGAVIEHSGNASTTGKRRFWRDYYYTRNRLLFFTTYLSGIKRLAALIFIILHLARHLLVLPFRGEKGRYQLKAELLGARDFARKSLGQARCLDWCED